MQLRTLQLLLSSKAFPVLCAKHSFAPPRMILAPEHKPAIPKGKQSSDLLFSGVCLLSFFGEFARLNLSFHEYLHSTTIIGHDVFYSHGLIRFRRIFIYSSCAKVDQPMFHASFVFAAIGVAILS